MTAEKKETHKMGPPSKQDEDFRVLGVAMIVDQRGVGARMVARYPTQPSPGTRDAGSIEGSNDDLFFTLTPRQMAKLFRTKKSLCGRPMTLSVNGTVFCSHATLMGGEDSGEDATTTTTSTEKKNQLVLFSVIVALSSPMSHTSVPFSSWLDGATEGQLDLQRYLKEATAAATSVHPGHVKQATRGSVSSSFLAIRRIHISLARYSRVLEREEHRCDYVSLQAERLFGVRNERQKKWDEQKVVTGSPNPKQVVGNSSSGASVMSTKSAQNPDRRGLHRRTGSLSGTVDELHHSIKDQRAVITAQEEQEREQEILELMMAAAPPEGRSVLHRGNLVRELVQFFHSLSRNDLQYPPTPTALLCERDGVVYINQHIAVPVEAASLRPSQTINGLVVRPYNTLLFPHASPSELLQAFQASGSAPPQRLQQVLLTVNPQKPLTEIAVDANLPLYTTIEIASYLVTHGACVISPVVSRSSRLACLHIEKIPQLALEFSQTFANVTFFRLVSFLTSAKTLGEAMLVLTGVDNDGEVGGDINASNVENDEGAWLRECLAPSGNVRQNLSEVLSFSPEEQSPKAAPTQPQEQPSRWVEELEELLFAMTIWLLSHRVLTQMQDYLVVVDSEGTTHQTGSANNNTNEVGDNLFRELLESKFLNGDVSIMTLSWRLGLDEQKLRSWGLRHNRIRVVSRIPMPSDDWESEST
jgi:hypothetical protein